MKSKIFVSFVEEAILNPQYEGFIGGRIEISYPGDHYPSKELRFFTKDKGFYKFRDKWDMKNVSMSELHLIEKTVREKYYEL